LLLLGVFIVAGGVLVAVINRLWSAVQPQASFNVVASEPERTRN
jgi:hypothetical protein